MGFLWTGRDATQSIQKESLVETLLKARMVSKHGLTCFVMAWHRHIITRKSEQGDDDGRTFLLVANAPSEFVRLHPRVRSIDVDASSILSSSVSVGEKT